MDFEIMTMAGLGLAAVAVLLFFAGVTAYILWHAISAQRKADLSTKWPRTEGRITTSQIVEIQVRDSDGTNRGLILEVEYEYSVAGVPYISNKRTLGKVPKSVPYKKADEVAARYTVGTVVPVFYNPANPQEACLEQEAPLSTLLLVIGLALLFILLCICCAIATIAWRYIQVEYLL